MVRTLVAVHSELDTADLPSGSPDGLDDVRLVRVLNRQDGAAVQVAAGLAHGATAVVVGPPNEEQWLRRCYELGASELVRIWDESWGEGRPSPVGIASLIAALAERDSYDLVLTGTAGSTWGTAYVGPAVAELLGAAQVDTVVSAALVGESAIEVVHSLARGFRRRVRTGLPAVLTVGDSAVAPDDPPSLGRMIEAQSAPVTIVRPAELGRVVTASPDDVRLSTPRPRAKRSAVAGGAAALNAIMGGGKRPAKKKAESGAADPAAQILAFLTERDLTPWRSDANEQGTRSAR
jgi:electron transfer flavoprotein beta subunit